MSQSWLQHNLKVQKKVEIDTGNGRCTIQPVLSAIPYLSHWWSASSGLWPASTLLRYSCSRSGLVKRGCKLLKSIISSEKFIACHHLREAGSLQSFHFFIFFQSFISVFQLVPMFALCLASFFSAAAFMASFSLPLWSDQEGNIFLVMLVCWVCPRLSQFRLRLGLASFSSSSMFVAYIIISRLWSRWGIPRNSAEQLEALVKGGIAARLCWWQCVLICWSAWCLHVCSQHASQFYSCWTRSCIFLFLFG